VLSRLTPVLPTKMLDWDKKAPNGNFRFAALQSETGKALLRRGGRDADDISSIVLATKGEGSPHARCESHRVCPIRRQESISTASALLPDGARARSRKGSH